jgi:hypothetical protein
MPALTEQKIEKRKLARMIKAITLSHIERALLERKIDWQEAISFMLITRDALSVDDQKVVSTIIDQALREHGFHAEKGSQG